MASAAQVAANQQNAQRSTGPITDAGKETCSRNATKHSLTASKLVLTSEEQAEFDAIREDLLEFWKPTFGYEHILFEDTVRAHWLWIRAQAVHSAVLDAIVKEERKADPKLTHDEARARIFTEEKNARRLRLLMRYEAAAERTFRKCNQELERVVSARMRAESAQRIAARHAARRAADWDTDLPVGSVSNTEPQAAAPRRR